MLRLRKASAGSTTNTENDSDMQIENDAYSTKVKRCCFLSSIIIFILILIHQCIAFIINLEPGHAMTYILSNRKLHNGHLAQSHTKRLENILKSHKEGHTLGEFFIYPRKDTSVNVKELPQSLQTHLFCGYNHNCSIDALCHCPITPQNTSHKFAIYPPLQFPSDITDFGWQKHFKIGYPPYFNASLYENSESRKEREAWNLFNFRLENGYCNNGAGMWSTWTKPGYHKCMARIVGERLNFKPGTKVLDIGSGCGHTLAAWTWWFGIWGMGIDFISSNVEFANKIAIKNNLNYHTYHASIQSLYINNWIPQQSFDFVFSSAVLMYVKRDIACRVMVKSIEILKKNGIAWFAWNDKISGMTQCIESYHNKRNNETISIDYYWLNETDFLDNCSKSPSRPSIIIRRLS